jgi:type IV pilus secretin PilQ/predicted competence protein
MQGHYRSIATWLMGGLLVMSIMALARPGAGATNSVTDVHYGTVDGAFKLTVVTSGAVTTQVHKYSVDSASDVQDLVIDVTPAAFDGRTKVIAFSDGPIRQVRVGQLSPAVMRIVVESKGSAKYDLNQKDGEKSVTLALTTSQQPHALDPEAAAAAARAAGARQTQSLSADMSTTPAQHTSLVPAPAVVAAAKPVAVEAPVKPIVHSAPEVVAKATPNPWLPGGKYYCKVPGMPGYRGGHSNSSASVAPSMSGPSYPSSPSRNTSTAMAPAGTVSIDIKNGDLLDVIKLLAQESGQNIVATASVKGTTTISLHNVPLREALDLIVRTNGLEYRQVGNIYVVGTPDELARQFGSSGQAAQTVAFPIRYASPLDLAKQLSTVLPASAFTIDTRTDTLLVSGTPEVIQTARNFMALEDVPAPQVVFEVKVIDVTKNNDAQNVGIDWTGSSTLGLFENCITCTSFQVAPNPPAQSGNPITFQPFTRNALFISAKINYLISHNQASLLADPRVEALDNQQAKILVGQTYPIVYYSSQAGQFQVNYIDVGVILQVTPVINTDGYITTTLHVERSTIAGLVANQYPILNNRKIDAILRVKDGDTIVMGGLVDDETTKTTTKVPLLGDIPVVGALFKNVSNTKLHNEIVFLITPHIVAEH